jgi:CubicO group peptidase (beta-lactamase class C family)
VRCLEQAGSWGASRVAVCVVEAGGVLGHYGDEDHSFAWASVTKLVTALAVLVAVEEGIVGLSDPAGPPGSTLAHLLAHASGCAPDDVSHVLAPPGARRIYSNAGIEEAAGHVAARAGMPFGDYVAAAVLEPLAMTTAVLVGSPAHGIEGRIGDLAKLAKELLSPRLVDPATLAMATTVAFPGLVGVLPGFGRQDPCDFGLGFEIRDDKHPHWTGTRCAPSTFGHFGQSGSFLWVDPVAKVACAGLADRPFGAWAARAWPRLADDVIEELGLIRHLRTGGG